MRCASLGELLTVVRARLCSWLLLSAVAVLLEVVDCLGVKGTLLIRFAGPPFSRSYSACSSPWRKIRQIVSDTRRASRFPQVAAILKLSSNLLCSKLGKSVERIKSPVFHSCSGHVSVCTSASAYISLYLYSKPTPLSQYSLVRP